MGEIGQVQCHAILAFHVSWFVVEFHRELFQHALMRREIQALPSFLCPVCVVMLNAVFFIQCFQMQRRVSDLGVKEEFLGCL